MSQPRFPILAALVGALFGAGLVISGMTQPDKVMNFLDITRAWDPSLALVMGSALVVFRVAWTRSHRHESPRWAPEFSELGAASIDLRLILGASIFGAGWALAGYCPGPALVSAAAFQPQALLFVLMMLLGFAAHDLLMSSAKSRGA